MAWCPMCGRFWLVRTGTYVRRAILGQSSNGVQEPLDLVCPKCEKKPAPERFV